MVPNANAIYCSLAKFQAEKNSKDKNVNMEPEKE
jgi:hypothetical protein